MSELFNHYSSGIVFLFTEVQNKAILAQELSVIFSLWDTTHIPTKWSTVLF